MHLYPCDLALAEMYDYLSCLKLSMTTLAGGFLVTNYYNAGHKVSKSNLDRGR